jgi:hypothetical protein
MLKKLLVGLCLASNVTFAQDDWPYKEFSQELIKTLSNEQASQLVHKRIYLSEGTSRAVVWSSKIYLGVSANNQIYIFCNEDNGWQYREIINYYSASEYPQTYMENMEVKIFNGPHRKYDARLSFYMHDYDKGVHSSSKVYCTKNLFNSWTHINFEATWEPCSIRD